MLRLGPRIWYWRSGAHGRRNGMTSVLTRAVVLCEWPSPGIYYHESFFVDSFFLLDGINALLMAKPLFRSI